MFVKVNRPEGNSNKGGSAKMANYLSKEQGTSFFNSDNVNVGKEQVISELDKNHKNLNSKDDKFYMISINPSHNEIKHLIGRDVNSFDELTPTEKEQLNIKLQSYTHDVMDKYALNFKRENVKSGKDLLYFGKIETERYYKHYDKEVQSGTKKTGQKKEGLNVHIHIVVSRNSKDQKAKLSPNGRFVGSKWTLKGKKRIVRGFSHIDFKQACIEKFNDKFKYKPKEKENYGAPIPQTIKGKIKGKTIAKVKQEILKDNFQTERNFINTGKKVISVVSNPGKGIKKEVLKKVKNLLLGKEKII